EKIFDCWASGLTVNSSSRLLNPCAVALAALPDAPAKGMASPAPTRPIPTETATKATRSRARCGIREADRRQRVTLEPERIGHPRRRFGLVRSPPRERYRWRVAR